MIKHNLILDLIKFGNLNKKHIPTTGSLTGTVFSCLGLTSILINAFSKYVKFDLYDALIKIVDLMGCKSMNSAFTDDSLKGKLGFSRSSIYEKLSSEKINWTQLSTCLMCKIAIFLFKLKGRKITDLFLVCDDSLMKRDRSSKKTELLAKIFDHNRKTYHKGYTLISLQLTDGKLSVPIGFRVLSSSNKDKIIGCEPSTKHNKRLDKRKRYAKLVDASKKEKAECLIDMIKEVRTHGITSDNLLFDSWFACPKHMKRLNEMGIAVTAMHRINTTRYYDANSNRAISTKELLDQIKIRIKNGEKLSDIPITVKVRVGSPNSNLFATLIMVKNWTDNSVSEKPYIPIISTNMSFSKEQIRRFYGYRWSIECSYKILKSLLNLEKGCQANDFKTTLALTSIAYMRYAVLIAAKELFFPEESIGDVLGKFQLQSSYGFLIQETFILLIEIYSKFHKQCTKDFNRSVTDKIMSNFDEAMLEAILEMLNSKLIVMMHNMADTNGFVFPMSEHA